MGRLGPGYGFQLRARLKELALGRERAADEAEALEQARELDADEVARRAEERRLDREGAAGDEQPTGHGTGGDARW